MVALRAGWPEVTGVPAGRVFCLLRVSAGGLELQSVSRVLGILLSLPAADLKGLGWGPDAPSCSVAWANFPTSPSCQGGAVLLLMAPESSPAGLTTALSIPRGQATPQGRGEGQRSLTSPAL